MINNRVFADGVPFTKQDINYARTIMNDGPCMYCALARAKFTRHNRKECNNDNSIRQTEPGSRPQYMFDDDQTIEILGCDKFSIDGHWFLMTTGLKYGYTQIDYCSDSKMLTAKGIISKHMTEFAII